MNNWWGREAARRIYDIDNSTKKATFVRKERRSRATTGTVRALETTNWRERNTWRVVPVVHRARIGSEADDILGRQSACHPLLMCQCFVELRSTGPRVPPGINKKEV